MLKGFAKTELLLALAVLLVVSGLIWGVKRYIDGVDRKGYERGQKETLLTVAERDNRALVAAHARIEELKALVQKKEDDHAEAIAMIDRDKTREVANVEARKERFIGDVVSGRIRLFDPGTRDTGCAPGGGGEGPAARGGAGVDPRAGGSQLSDELGGFLVREAARADKVALTLQACQRIVEEDRKVQ